MKYFIILLFYLCTTIAMAQTYTVIIDGRLPPANNNPNPSWGDGTITVRGGNVNFQFRNFDRGGPLSENVQFIETVTNRSFSSLQLTTVYSPPPPARSCNDSSTNSESFPVNELIPTPTGGGGGLNTCSSYFSVDAIPQMTITGTTGNVCAGSTIDLANNQNFPSEAYTWNFRIRNSRGDQVPGGGRIDPSFYTSNLKGASFNMIDLLGADLANNIGNTVEFYLGAQNIIFSNLRSITIDSCTPLLDERYPENTSCSDSSDGAVEVSLLSGLDPSENETLLVTVNAITPEGFIIPEYSVDILGLVSSVNGTNTFSLSNLTPGTYEVDYQSYIDPDGAGGNPPYPYGLGIPFNFEILAPSPLIIEDLVTVRDPFCPGELGERRIEVSGGQNLRSGEYFFTKDGGTSWQTSSNANDFTYDDLIPGDAYTFGVKIAYPNGDECLVSTNISQTIPNVTNPITLSNSTDIANQPSNSNAEDGSIYAQISGGTANFTFELYELSDPSNAIRSIPSQALRFYEFQNLGIGSYFIRIIDNNGCEVDNESAPFELTAAPLPILGLPLIIPPTCTNESNGSATIEVTYPTTSSFSYQLRDGIDVIRSGTTSTNIISLTDLEPRDFILYVISDVGDFNNAETVVTVDIFVVNPISVTIDTYTPNGISCFGASDGSISVTASGGNSYEYTLELFPNSTDWFPLVGNTIENLSYGFFYLTIRNENGCQSEIIDNSDILIDNTTIITLNTLSTNATTNAGSDGSISLEITGGTPFTTPENPYTITWTKETNGTVEAFNDADASTPYELVGLEAGIYRATVTDANGCNPNPNPVEISIDEPGPLRIETFTGTQITCNGANDGSLTTNIQGTLPATYIWVLEDGSQNGIEVGRETNGLNTATISNLGPGTYSVSVEDADVGPIRSPNTVTITNPDIIDALITNTPSCFGADMGTISISGVTGGTLNAPSNYTYSIDNGQNFQNAPDFIDLPQGIYEVVVSDDNNCVYTETVNITNTPEIVFDAVNSTSGNVSAQGNEDGFISPLFNGGFGQLSFSWTGPSVGGITTQNIENLGPGTYTITVTDENQCSIIQEFIITEPGPLSITINQENDISCFEASDGSIFTTVTGEAPIIYTWIEATTGILTTTAEDDIEGLPPGIYTLTVTDASTTPAVTSAQIEIIEPVVLTAEVFATDIGCAGEATGSILINAVGGSAGYEYSLDGGTTYLSTATLNGLSAGANTVRIQDANGCTVDVPFTINEPLAIGADIAPQALSQAGAADGAITTISFGGTGNLTFDWTGPNGFTSNEPSITGLIGGNYQLTISDDNNCVFTSNIVEIAEPGELLAAILQTVFLECNVDDFGEITANVQGGVPPYTYQWFETTFGNETVLPETTEILGNLSAGSFFLRVTDANGISIDSDTIPISEPELLEIQIDSTVPVLCSGEFTGAIAITVTGGTLPYTYNWDNGAVTEDVSGVSAGDYNVLVTDANGCFAALDITLDTAPGAIQISNSTVTNLSDYQTGDGSIVLEITGGATPYTINWTRASDNQNLGTDRTVENLSADSYSVSITDANGCGITEIYEVTQPDIVEETIVTPTCTGEANGSISLLVNRGNGNFTYSWQTGEITDTITNLMAGSYTVTINGFGDGPLTRTYSIEDPLPLEVDLGPDRTLCLDQVLLLDATVADETATYRWSSDTGFSDTASSVTLSTTGNYMVTVQTASGCTAVGAIFVDISTEEINAEFAMSSQVFTGETLVVVDISYPLPETLEWILPESASILKQDNDEAEIVFDQPGEYEIGIITTRGDCIATQTKKVIVSETDVTINEDTEAIGEGKSVKEFLVYPNPTTGQFTADVTLPEAGNISINIFNFSNNTLMATERARGDENYSIPFDISGMPTGVYAVVLETPYGTSLRKVVVR